MQIDNPIINTLALLSTSVNPDKWVALHSDYLYTYAISRVNDEEQARDLVQETFLGALKQLQKFEGRSSERTWLTAILKNKIIDVYRKKSSRLNLTKDLPDNESHDQDFFDAEDGHWSVSHRPKPLCSDVEDKVVNKEFMQILQKCMQKLPALWLSVFTMKHMDEDTTELICLELKITPANLWVIIHRAKLNLRACLQKNWL